MSVSPSTFSLSELPYVTMRDHTDGSLQVQQVDALAARFFLSAKKGEREAAEGLEGLAKRGVAAAQFFLGYLHKKRWHPCKSFALLGEYYISLAAKNHYEPAVALQRRRAPQGVAPVVRYCPTISQAGVNLSFWSLVGLPPPQTTVSPKERIIRAVYQKATAFQVGNGVPRDLEHAIQLYRWCAEQGELYSQAELSQLLLEHHPEEAFHWAKEAVRSGWAVAWINLGLCYEEGKGTPKDMDRALACYKKAAEKNDPEGMYLYGSLLYLQNVDEALKILREAALRGSSLAIKYLQAFGHSLT